MGSPQRLDPRGSISRKSRGRSSVLSSAARRYCANSSLTDEVIRSFYNDLDTPRSLACWLMYTNGEHKQLVEQVTSPLNYNDFESEKFWRDYSATQFLSKSKWLKTGIDTSAVAMQSFFDCEAKCRETNSRFQDLAALFRTRRDAAHIVNSVARKVSMVLYDDFNVDEWFDNCAWGPGTTVALRGDDTGPERKFLQEGGITPTLRRFVEPLWPRIYSSWSPSLVTTPGSRVLTVDKNAKTDRVIAAEPGINSWFQAGIGQMISKRLLRHGVDLKYQDRNQLLAFLGAATSGAGITGNECNPAHALATLDMKAASDTISTGVVETLLPTDWCHALELTRSRYSEVDGKWLRLEKFSSMGNGFTFPLQSTIFLAIALGACEHVGVDSSYVGIYGDDVVIPTIAASTYAEWCAFFGFTLNPTKSYISGCFRESCGAHYFLRRDVKPLFLSERLRSLASVFELANGLKRFAGQGYTFGLYGRVRPTWLLLFNAVPKSLRFRIPQGFGDGGFVVDLDDAVPFVKRAGNWVEGYFYTSVQFIPVGHPVDHAGVLHARVCVRGTHNAESYQRIVDSGELHTSLPGKGNEALFRRATKLRINFRTFCHKWPSRGDWLG